MSFTFKTIQGTYPGAGAGSRVTFDLSQAMNDGAGTQIEAVRRTMYLDDLTASGSISIAANDDASTNPPGTFYVVTEHINGAPDRTYQITIPAAATSPIQLATIPHASGGTVTYGIASLTSADASVVITTPAPGVRDLSVVGGGGGGGGGGAPPSTVTPLTDVTGGAVGTATPYSREDHRHPLSSAYATAAGLTAETTRATAAEGTNAAAITSEAATARAAESANATAIAAKKQEYGREAGFTANGTARFIMLGAQTLDIANAIVDGTATVTYWKALLATPSTYTQITTSTGFVTGDRFEIRATGVSGTVAVAVPRSA